MCQFQKMQKTSDVATVIRNSCTSEKKAPGARVISNSGCPFFYLLFLVDYKGVLIEEFFEKCDYNSEERCVHIHLLNLCLAER